MNKISILVLLIATFSCCSALNSCTYLGCTLKCLQSFQSSQNGLAAIDKQRAQADMDLILNCRGKSQNCKNQPTSIDCQNYNINGDELKGCNSDCYDQKVLQTEVAKTFQTCYTQCHASIQYVAILLMITLLISFIF